MLSLLSSVHPCQDWWILLALNWAHYLEIHLLIEPMALTALDLILPESIIQAALLHQG